MKNKMNILNLDLSLQLARLGSGAAELFLQRGIFINNIHPKGN